MKFIVVFFGGAFGFILSHVIKGIVYTKILIM